MASAYLSITSERSVGRIHVPFFRSQLLISSTRQIYLSERGQPSPKLRRHRDDARYRDVLTGPRRHLDVLDLEQNRRAIRARMTAVGSVPLYAKDRPVRSGRVSGVGT